MNFTPAEHLDKNIIMQTLISHHSQITLGIFITLMAIFLLLEQLIKFKKTPDAAKHFLNNIALSIFNTIVLRIALPFNLIFIAIYAQENNIGVLNLINFPDWLEILLSLIIFDLIIYWQHRLMHNVPILWKLHGVHHSDQLIDVSTGVRFHIFEIIFSFSIKIVVVVSLGLSPLTVVLFEILLSSFSLFVHSNLLLPEKVNSILKRIIITPETHRIHHTILEANIQPKQQTQKTTGKTHNATQRKSNQTRYLSYNYSTSIHIWDHIFNSYLGSYKESKEQAFGRVKNGETIISNSITSMLKEPFIHSK